MGLGSWFKGVINHVKVAITHGVKAIQHATPKVFKAVVNATKTVANFAGKQVATVYSDVKSGISTLEKDSMSIVKGGQGLIGSLGSSFAMPLALAAGAVGVAFVLTR